MAVERAAATFIAHDTEGDQYVVRVRDRAAQLVDSGIWKGIAHGQLDRWLENFHTPNEKYFGACLLDSLVFRSEDQVQSQIRHTFQRVVPQMFGPDADLSVPASHWGDALCSDTDEGIRLVPVLRPDDPPTKSGPLIARLMKRAPMRLNEKWMIWPWQIRRERKRGLNHFLFVDDFLGTGTQFSRFAKVFRLRKELEGTVSGYAPLTAHTSGIARIASELIPVAVGAAEVLSARHELFNAKSEAFKDGTNSPAGAQSFYTELCTSRALAISGRYILGFGGLALSYAFSHAVPNNCLPLFWHRESHWQPLLER